MWFIFNLRRKRNNQKLHKNIYIYTGTTHTECCFYFNHRKELTWVVGAQGGIDMNIRLPTPMSLAY
jgi:hypothetical protein